MKVSSFNNAQCNNNYNNSFGLRFNPTTLKALMSSPQWAEFEPIVSKAQRHSDSDVYTVTISNITKHLKDETAGIQAEFVSQNPEYRPVVTETEYGIKALRDIMSRISEFVEKF